MWVMLIKDLPAVVSPPRFSIFWSTPWVHEKQARRQKKAYAGHRSYWRDYESDKLELDEQPDFFYDQSGWGKDANAVLARAIVFEGQTIRVFAHEFSAMDNETMSTFVYGRDEVEGDSASHVLMPGEAAGDALINGVLDGETRPIYDAALVDGCNHAQAMSTALGIDITLPDADFPPLGWYRPRIPYAQIFYSEREMEQLATIVAESGATI